VRLSWRCDTQGAHAYKPVQMDLSVNLKRGREQAPPLAPLTGTNGDHAELLARRGMYYSLYNSQFTEAVGAPS
jgi:hypothetical protein